MMYPNGSTQLARALLRTPLANMTKRNLSACPPEAKKPEPARGMEKPVEEKIKAVPYQATPEVCLRRPLIVTPRADDVFGPLKNHQRPYRRYFFDPERPALVTPSYEHIPCIVEFLPRRERKVVETTTTCMKESQCEVKGERDQCRKLTCPGCAVARVPSKFPEEQVVDWCYRVEPPKPSFHECVKSAIPDLSPTECLCLTDRGPPCDPATLRKPAQANR